MMASVCNSGKVEATQLSELLSADWGTFRFDDLSNQINAASGGTYEPRHVSDHYPVFVTLY